MKLRDLRQSLELRSPEDPDFLRACGLFDESAYRSRAGLFSESDAISHYLERGWRLGFNPREEFDGDFLRPYYEACGLFGPPALIWLELSCRPGQPPPINAKEAVTLAEHIRASRFFDGAGYAERLDRGMDPALHYAVVGEPMGWPASGAFDVTFYLERNQDLVSLIVSPLLHYTRWGCDEGRKAVPVAARLGFPPVGGGSPSVLFILHEASGKGFLSLAGEIMRGLAATYNVVSVLCGGAMEAQFAAISTAVIGPLACEEWQPPEMADIAARLVNAYGPIYAIAPGLEANLLVPALAQLGVPNIALVDRFAADTDQLTRMRSILDWATHIVFPSRRIEQAAYDAFPASALRCGLHQIQIGIADSGCAIDAYVELIDSWGKTAAAGLRDDDLWTLVESGVIDPTLALPPGLFPPGILGVERHVLMQWAVMGTTTAPESNQNFRRPCAGFHPQIYAQFHKEACAEGAENPLSHWVRAGRPGGAWSRRVFSPLTPPFDGLRDVRAALHIHFYYTENAENLSARLAVNQARCDLFISTDTEAKAAFLRRVFGSHRDAVDIRVMPNRGRDIGPFLTGFSREITEGGYDMFGHLHGKQSPGVDGPMGNLWRAFLWDNLIGDRHGMLDLAAAAFAADPKLGLLMAEDPHLVGWNENRAIAEQLAERMGVLTPLDDFFDFPLGTMFWARPAALRPLLELGLDWNDYPAEPIAADGTLLHALERFIPYATKHAGLEIAGMRAPDTTW